MQMHSGRGVRDLSESDAVSIEHVLEALQYRPKLNL